MSLERSYDWKKRDWLLILGVIQPISSTVPYLLLRIIQRAACQQTLLALTCSFKIIELVLSTAYCHIWLAYHSRRHTYFQGFKQNQTSHGQNVDLVEQKLLKVVPAQFKVDVHHWLILHGRYTCIARKPRCGSCLIEDLCEFKDKTED